MFHIINGLVETRHDFETKFGSFGFGSFQRNKHTPQSRPEREPLHYAELDLVRAPNSVNNSNSPTIDRVRRTGQATPYAEIQLPV